MSQEPPKAKFTGSVDLSSIDAMFATTISKLENLKERIDDQIQVLGQQMESRFDSQDATIGAIREQTTRTNGRLGEAEKGIVELKNYKSSIRNRVIGFIAFGTAAGGLVGWAIEAGLRFSFKAP